MEFEIVSIPKRRTKSNPHWEEIAEKFENLQFSNALRITGIDRTQANALRTQATRVAKARSCQREEDGKLVLYLYKRL